MQDSNTPKFNLDDDQIERLAEAIVEKLFIKQEEADAKFEAWATEKEAKIQAKVEGLTKAEVDERAKALAAEKEVNEKRIADAKAVEEEAIAAEAAAKAEAEAEAAAEAAAEEATEEAPAAEEATEDAAEDAPAAE